MKPMRGVSTRTYCSASSKSTLYERKRRSPDLWNRVRHKRPALRLIVSSATIDAAAFLEYFSSGSSLRDVTVASLEGRMHPVEVAYLREPTSDYVRTAAGVANNIHTHVGTDVVLALLGHTYLPDSRMVRVIFWCFSQVVRR